MEIRWTEDAELDILDIYEYIDADKPVAAASVVRRLHQAVNALENHAPAWRLRGASSLRELVASGLPYIVYYTLERDNRDEDIVLIVRILHAAMDWKGLP